MPESAPLFRVEGGPPVPAGEALWVKARSGDRLRAAIFRPEGAPRGSVVLSPGRTEMIEKYGEVAGEMVARGFVVLIHDWVGQGLSTRLHRDPLRGHIRGGAARFLADVTDVLSAVEARLPRPWIAVGHSMGGGLTALALAEGRLKADAAVLSAPMCGVLTGAQPPVRVRFAARMMALLGRGAALPLPQIDPLRDVFDNNVLTHDASRFARTQALIAAHPELRLGGPTWDWLRFAFDLHDRLARKGAAEGVTMPVEVLIAAEEKLVDNAATRAFAARLPQGMLSAVAGSRHEILMETPDRREAFWTALDRVSAAVG